MRDQEPLLLTTARSLQLFFETVPRMSADKRVKLTEAQCAYEAANLPHTLEPFTSTLRKD